MLTRVQPLLKQNSTAILYREVQGFAGKSLLPKQDPCNENRVPVPCNGNRLFPVIIDLQGVPCKPYRVWVCSEVTDISLQ